jgi:Protein of unknown function (DUF3891)
MIIRRLGTTPLLITQPDHAQLAATIMERWQGDGFPDSPRRAAILLAIREHDNGWREVDAAPILDANSGEILDFMTLPDEDRRGVWPRGVQRLAATPYSAALVAQHAVHIYRRYRDDTAWIPFFIEMEAWRDHFILQERSVTMDELLRDYRFLRIGDLASLTFCNGWSEAPEETGLAVTFDSEHLAISPDPFAGERLSIEITAREMPGTRFASAREATAVFIDAPTVILTGTVSGAAA